MKALFLGKKRGKKGARKKKTKMWKREGQGGREREREGK